MLFSSRYCLQSVNIDALNNEVTVVSCDNYCTRHTVGETSVEPKMMIVLVPPHDVAIPPYATAVV